MGMNTTTNAFQGLQPHQMPRQMPHVDPSILTAFLTPLQQALGRSVIVTPQQGSPSAFPATVLSTAAPLVASTTAAAPPLSATSGNKRPAIISDDGSDTSSDIDSAGVGGPRLKRFKKRLEQSSSTEN